jgi:hypothetical protein
MAEAEIHQNKENEETTKSRPEDKVEPEVDNPAGDNEGAATEPVTESAQEDDDDFDDAMLEDLSDMETSYTNSEDLSAVTDTKVDGDEADFPELAEPLEKKSAFERGGSNKVVEQPEETEDSFHLFLEDTCKTIEVSNLEFEDESRFQSHLNSFFLRCQRWRKMSRSVRARKDFSGFSDVIE